MLQHTLPMQAAAVASEVALRSLPYLPRPVALAALRRALGRHPLPEAQRFFELALGQIGRYMREGSRQGRNKMIRNLFHNQVLYGQQRRKDLTRVLGFELPVLLVVSPTMRCPLNCYGCYSGEYARDEDLSFDAFDDLLTQATDLGIHFYVISGGEPFVYPHIHDVFRAHPDCWFQVYTSGITLANETHARALARLGNVMPCISVEGYRDETDARRGKGHFDRVLAAMANLRRHGVPFGFSVTATAANHDTVVSDDFVDFYADQGAFFGYYFQYMPVGRNPAWELVPSPEQRRHRWERVNALRRDKGLVLIDFWNDGPLVGGCLAGGRRYLHIDHKGNVEPCVFVQHATDNIYESRLLDILQHSPLLKAIRKRQPYSENLMRPCMIIDVPNVLRDVLEETGAGTNDGVAHPILGAWAKRIDDLAGRWGTIADDLWTTHYETAYQPWAANARRLQRDWQDRK